MRDEYRIIEAFLKHNRDSDIAQELSCSLRTVQNYKHDVDLQKKIATAKAEAIKQAINKMQLSLYDATNVLVSIINNEEIAPQIRLNAINMLFSACKNWMRDTDMTKVQDRTALYQWDDIDI